MIAHAAGTSGDDGEQRKLMFVDIGKAHLFGKIEAEEFIELPSERAALGKCGKLVYTLYGMRVAASNWERGL